MKNKKINSLNKLFFQRKNTKGSHVGIILSFTFFITFLIFTYAVLGPVITREGERDNSLDELENLVNQEIYENIISIRLYNSSTIEECISIDKPSNNFEIESLIVKNSTGTEITSSIVSDKIWIESGNGFSKIYLSNNAFKSTNTSFNPPCTSISYDSLLNQSKITEKKILDLVNKSVSNYSSLQNNFGVNYEFDILFDYKNGTIIGERRSDVKEDIYARTLNTEYLSLKAEEKIGDVILKIW